MICAHYTFKEEVAQKRIWLVGGMEFLGKTNYVKSVKPNLLLLIHNIYFGLILRSKIL